MPKADKFITAIFGATLHLVTTPVAEKPADASPAAYSLVDVPPSHFAVKHIPLQYLALNL